MQFRKILPWVAAPAVALAIGFGGGTVARDYFDGRNTSVYERMANPLQNTPYKSTPFKPVSSQQASAATTRKTFDFAGYLDKFTLSPSFMTAGEFNTKLSESVRDDARVYTVNDIDATYSGAYVDSPGIDDFIIVWGKNGINRRFSTAEDHLDRDALRIDKPTGTKFVDIQVDGDKVIYVIERDGIIEGSDENIGVTGNGNTPLHSVQAWVYYPEDDVRKGVGSYDTFNFDSSVWVGSVDRDAAPEIIISTSGPVRTFSATYDHVSNRKNAYSAQAFPSRSKSTLQVYEITPDGFVYDYGVIQEVDKQLTKLQSASSRDDIERVMDGSSLGIGAITTMFLAGDQLQNAIDAKAAQRVEELGAEARAQVFKAVFQMLTGDTNAALSIIEANKYRNLADITIASSGFYSSPGSAQPFNNTTGSVYDPSTATYRTGGVDLPKTLIPGDIKAGLDRGVLTPDQMTTLNSITSKYKSANPRTGSSSSNSSSSGSGSSGFDFNAPHGNYDPAKDPRAEQNARDRESIEKAVNDFNDAANDAAKGLNETADSISDFLSGLLDDKKKK